MQAHTTRLLRAATLAFTGLLLASVPVSARTPTIGISRGSFTPDQVVYYHWAATYPTWLTSATQDSLDTKFRSWTNNNSHSPRPAYGGGSAIVYYSQATTSPCNSQINTDWLACTTMGGGASFRIYVRDFVKSGKQTWGWWDESQACARSGATLTQCWYLRRAVIHEAGHAIPTFGHDDAKTEDDTVMRSKDPVVGAYGGNHYVFQRCDQAALQLLWDVARYDLPYGDCFDGIADHGVRGLVSTLTTNGTSFSVCASVSKTIGGRLAVKADSYYGPLSNNPLAARTIRFDRKRHVDALWTANVASTTATAAETGTDWTAVFSAPARGVAYDYRAHFDGDAGLDPSQAIFTINWTPC